MGPIHGPGGYSELIRFVDDREALAHLVETAAGRTHGSASPPSLSSPPGAGSSDANRVCHVLCSENAKNIPFVVALSGGRLNSRTAASAEKDSGSVYSRDDSRAAGDGDTADDTVVNDFARAGGATGGAGSAEGGSPDKETASSDPVMGDHLFYNDELEYNDVTNIEGDVVVDIDVHYKSKHSLRWPSSIAGIEVGLRVDALDHRGQWFAGSVVSVWEVSPAEAEELCPAEGTPSAGLPSEAGLHIRVHFDNFSPKWDEWYGSKDFAKGRLAPVYTQSPRKLKVLDLVIVHRAPVATADVATGGDEGAGSGPAEGRGARGGHSGKYQLMSVPSVLQCESFRSCDHVYKHVIEQAMRFATDDEMQKFVGAYAEWCESGATSAPPYNALPFTVRVGSLSNPSITPLEASEDAKAKIRALGPAKQHQAWEGALYPLHDKQRPLCNIFFNRFIVIIDWKPSLSSAFPKAMIDSSDRSKLNIIRFLALQTIEDDFFEKRRKALEAEAASQGGGATTGSTAKAKGVTLQDCLNAFAGNEEQLDENSWYCEKCKKPSRGSVLTSLARLPDVLIIHIKRFGMNARWREKIRTRVNFPFRALDMRPYTAEMVCKSKGDNGSSRSGSFSGPSLGSPPSKGFPPRAELNFEADGTSSPDNDRYLYDLYGVANHIGSMSGGHYTAFVRCGGEEAGVPVEGSSIESTQPSGDSESFPSVGDVLGLDGLGTKGEEGAYNAVGDGERWFLFDDDSVEELPSQGIENHIVSESAYVLFYRRRQMTSSCIINLSS